MARFGRTLALIGLGIFLLTGRSQASDAPEFEVDPFWPKPLPNQWIIGSVAGIYVDAQDHVWINHRPGSLTEREIAASEDPRVECCVAAPEIIEFDQDGNVVQAWRGPGEGPAQHLEAAAGRRPAGSRAYRWSGLPLRVRHTSA